MKAFYPVLLLLIFTACTQSDDSANEESTSQEAVQVKTDSNAPELHPCAIFTSDNLQEVVGTIEGEIKEKLRGSPYPSCLYVWQSNTKQEVQTGNISYEVIPENRVTITLVRGEISETAWDAATEVYPSDMVVVPDLGTKSVWSDKFHQCTVLTDRGMFHVNVEYYDAEGKNREIATTIARQFIGNF